MTYLLLALGTYFLVELVRAFVSAPSWAWPLVGLVVAATFLLAKEPNTWYLAPAVAGGAQLLQRLDDLLLCRADESRFDLMKRYRQ